MPSPAWPLPVPDSVRAALDRQKKGRKLEQRVQRLSAALLQALLVSSLACAVLIRECSFLKEHNHKVYGPAVQAAPGRSLTCQQLQAAAAAAADTQHQGETQALKR